MRGLIMAAQQQARAGVLILDIYPGAVGGFSLRLINSAYTGNCVQVQRDADDALLDVGFVGGVVDVAALETFADGGQLNVRTWYDQSGLGNNAIQTDKAAQPWIAAAGSVYIENGKPTIYFDGASGNSIPGFVLASPRLVTQKNFIIAAVLRQTQTSGRFYAPINQHAGFADAQRANFIAKNSSQEIYINIAGTGAFYYSVLDDHTQKSILSISSANDIYMSVNGQQETLVEGVADFAPLNTDFTIGALGNKTLAIKGWVQEVMVYNEDRYNDRIGLQNNINAYYSIY